MPATKEPIRLLRSSFRDALGLSYCVLNPRVHLEASMRWLCRAQDAATDGGVARSYSLRFKRSHNRKGWLGAYPETTGYITPTFFNYSAFTNEEEYRQRAIRMAQWEVEVQMECGAVQGGTVDFPPTRAVFITGEVLFGWTRADQETGDSYVLSVACRAVDFLVED